MIDCEVRLVAYDEFDQAQSFYESVGYYAKIQKGNVALAAFDDGQMVGLVRLALENESLVLRGMMIQENHQRKGLGSKMLTALESHIGKSDCYCLPHDWLEGFYGQIGFKKVSELKAPNFLRDRLSENRKKYPHLIMMLRSGSKNE